MWQEKQKVLYEGRLIKIQSVLIWLIQIIIHVFAGLEYLIILFYYNLPILFTNSNSQASIYFEDLKNYA